MNVREEFAVLALEFQRRSAIKHNTAPAPTMHGGYAEIVEMAPYGGMVQRAPFKGWILPPLPMRWRIQYVSAFGDRTLGVEIGPTRVQALRFLRSQAKSFPLT